MFAEESSMSISASRQGRCSGFSAERFGLPTSDEFEVPDGRQTNFQGGWIRWVSGTGEILTS